jgi:PAS domain S-box-containing protein
VFEAAVELRDEQGVSHGSIGMYQDITARKQAEDNLRKAEAKYRMLVEQIPPIVYLARPGQNVGVTYISPQIKTLGFTEEEWIADPDLWLRQIHPDDQAKVMEHIGQMSQSGEPYKLEYRLRTRTGVIRWFIDEVKDIVDETGNILFRQGFMLDITERKQAEELIQRQLRRLNALHTIDMAINSNANIQITLEVLLSQVLSQLSIDAADVLLFNQPAQTLELTASRGFRSNISLQSQQRLSDGFADQVINSRRTIHISNVLETGKNLKQIRLLANDDFVEYFGVPLIAKGFIKGVLEIYHRSPVTPEDDWLNFLEVLAERAAIAIDNAQLLQGLQRSNMELILAYDATIEGWSRAMDLRDKETEGHTQRVTAMTLKLARTMGIREADILHIQRGGLLHDIGKLGIPDNILLKTENLTEEEWQIMRQHPAYALNMISPITYLKPALDIPYCHHEKWDGTGYPRGLKGEQIPLAARIFAVVDVWDALTSDRPYRKTWTKEQTIEYIQEQSEKHFDPQVVKAFLELISEGQGLRS